MGQSKSLSHACRMVTQFKKVRGGERTFLKVFLSVFILSTHVTNLNVIILHQSLTCPPDILHQNLTCPPDILTVTLKKCLQFSLGLHHADD